MAVAKGVTRSGFSFEFDEEVLDNMELVEAAADMTEDVAKLGKVMSMLLGEEQKKALYNHVRNEKGRIPIAAVNEEMVDIFKAVNSGKNS